MTTYWDISTTCTAIEMYKNGVSPEEIAERLNRTTRSVVVKLAKEGVYNKKESTTRLKKEDLVCAVESLLNLDTGVLVSLKSGTHESLNALYNALKSKLETHCKNTL